MIATNSDESLAEIFLGILMTWVAAQCSLEVHDGLIQTVVIGVEGTLKKKAMNSTLAVLPRRDLINLNSCPKDAIISHF